MTQEQMAILETATTSEIVAYITQRWGLRGGSGILFFSVPLASDGSSEVARHVFGDPILAWGCAECALDMARANCRLSILSGTPPRG